MNSSMSIAVFTAIHPEDVRTLFGETFLFPEDAKVHFFSVDAILSKKEVHTKLSLFHYMAFPNLHKRSPYTVIIYIFDDSIASHSFIPYLVLFPGIIFIEKSSIHKNRFLYHTKRGSLDYYEKELVALYGEKGKELAANMRRKGIDEYSSTHYPMIEMMTPHATGCVVTAPSIKRSVEDLMTIDTIFLSGPILVDCPIKNQSQELHKKNYQEIINRNKILKIGVLGSDEKHYYRHDRTSFEQFLKSEIDLDLDIQYFELSNRDRILSRSNTDAGPRETTVLTTMLSDFTKFVRDRHILVSMCSEYGWIEMGLISIALGAETPCIVSSSSIMSQMAPHYLLKIYEGRHEHRQISEYLKELVKKPDMLNYLSNPAENKVFSIFDYGSMCRDFHTFLKNIYSSGNNVKEWTENDVLLHKTDILDLISRDIAFSKDESLVGYIQTELKKHVDVKLENRESCIK